MEKRMESSGRRKKILTGRDTLTGLELAEKSRSAVDRLLSLLFDDPASNTVMFYASFRSEVQTGQAIRACLERGMKVVLPLTDPEVKQLVPYLINDPENDLCPGYCGIPEPDPTKTEIISAAGIDTVIVPGSVFDLRGGRYGYGGGYYDRFLRNEASRALRIALAFELQVVEDNLQLEPHDQLMHCLVTESRTVRFK